MSKKIDKELAGLGGTRIIELGLGDEDETSSKNGGMIKDFDVWSSQLLFNINHWSDIAADNNVRVFVIFHFLIIFLIYGVILFGFIFGLLLKMGLKMKLVCLVKTNFLRLDSYINTLK